MACKKNGPITATIPFGANVASVILLLVVFIAQTVERGSTSGVTIIRTLQAPQWTIISVKIVI